MPGRIDEYETLLTDNPIWRRAQQRRRRAARPRRCWQLGVTGPMLRSAGVALRPPQGRAVLRATRPTTSTCRDAHRGRRVRALRASGWTRCGESMRIVEQCLERLERPGPGDGRGPEGAAGRRSSRSARTGSATTPRTSRHIMEESMEALIHHFKMVTQGVRGAAGRGLPGRGVAARRARLLRRVRRRPPAVPRARSATRRSSTCRRRPAMVEGALVADAIAAIASIDPVMGGVDR